ncbi:MAG: penicillin-insensitive murein endopeptidase, partial [Pseudomonadota bacterium]
MLRWILLAVIGALALGGTAVAEPAAKTLFGRAGVPSEHDPAPYGSYARGCIAGAMALRETGPAWQAMRLSRNRNWGHPAAIAFIERLGVEAQAIGWPGLYIGDISQPRGGPMTSGHASHQIGLDLDIWFRAGDADPWSRADRERIGA